MCMNDNETVNQEIDALCATPEQEEEIRLRDKEIESLDAEVKEIAQKVWDTQVAPCAALMLDGEYYVLNKPKMPHRFGLDAEIYMGTAEGKEAEKLIAAGFFEKGGQLLQFAMRENALENACDYLGYDLIELREFITE